MNTKAESVKRQVAESRGWIKLCLDHKLSRCSVDRLRRAVDPERGFTPKLLKAPSLGYLCRPISGQKSEKVRPWGPPTQSHRIFHVAENKPVTKPEGSAKAKKPFRINNAQSQRQSQEVI